MVLLLDTQATGPASRFTDSDVFFILDFLSDGKTTSRIKLANYLGLGEGSVRGLLSILEGFGFVEIKQVGVSICPAGQNLLAALGMRTVTVNVSKYALGKYHQGVLIRGAAEKVFNGIDQRDAGIRAGGDGCTTWAMIDKNLMMLPNWNMDDHDPQIAERIRTRTMMDDGDVLVVGGGETIHMAMSAAGTAALELV